MEFAEFIFLSLEYIFINAKELYLFVVCSKIITYDSMWLYFKFIIIIYLNEVILLPIPTQHANNEWNWD